MPPKAMIVCVKGCNRTTSSTKVSAVIWNILDDSGHPRTLRIQNMCSVPVCPLRILSPLCHSQQTDEDSTHSTNFGELWADSV
jgi:hypothetical protein